jgi:hypothetical protein
MRQVALSLFILIISCHPDAYAQENLNNNLFRQLTGELPTPDQYRTASGRPGPAYFQQQADYVMDIRLDEKNRSVSGSGTITYRNNSPETLEYLYLQLDQNVFEPQSFGNKVAGSTMAGQQGMSAINRLDKPFDGGFRIGTITGIKGTALQTVRNHTILKVLLDSPLPPGQTTRLTLTWQYPLNNLRNNWGRSGYDPMDGQDDGTYAIAQFYPRLCVFNDRGWQIKQFIDAEFALEFGNFDVSITVPADHIVGATGVLQNGREVLGGVMLERLARARTSPTPVFIVTPEEAAASGKGRSEKLKTWRFKAENVRDFAFASSRRFIWHALNVTVGRNQVMAMAFYPNESALLWNKYAVKTIAQTLKSYSSHTFDYPYPVAQAVDASMGMEYPMMAFCGGRPNVDGSYDKGTRDWVIGVIRHEVGHNYFPMIVNSDERQWAWMDEGFNVFMQGMADREWDLNPNYSGKPTEMIGYMNSDPKTQVPIMTDADALLNGGMNSYRKPAAGLTILRETILGRELFDQAFREYATTWMFKHPQPADFFRIMEDASGVDLDWFWRGWFFTTDHVDLAIDRVTVYEPVYDEASSRKAAEYRNARIPVDISVIRDKELFTREIDRDTSLRDKYDEPQPLISEPERARAEAIREKLTPEEMALLQSGKRFYEITFKSLGGMIMPLIVEFEFVDGTREEVRLPAEIWLRNQEQVTRVFPFGKEVRSITLDPRQETADVDITNNRWPRQTERVFYPLRK